MDDLTASGQVYTCEASFLPGPIGPWLLLLNDTWKQLGLPYDIIALSCVYVGLNPCVRPFGGPIETAGPSYWWPYCLPVFPIGGPIVLVVVCASSSLLIMQPICKSGL